MTPASRSGTPSASAHGVDHATQRRTRLLALATAASAVFTLIHYPPLRLVTVPGGVAVILLVAAVVAAVAAQLRQAAVVAAVGIVLLLLGLIRLVTYGHGSGLIGGASSTAALLTALGIGYLGIIAGRG